MKDSTKRRIAFEICYFFGLLQFRGLPLLLGIVLKVFGEDYLNIFKKHDLYGSEDANKMLIMGFSFTLSLMYIPYFIRFIQWVKKWNGNEQYKCKDWKEKENSLFFLCIILINFVIGVIMLVLNKFTSPTEFGFFFIPSFFSSMFAFFIENTKGI